MAWKRNASGLAGLAWVLAVAACGGGSPGAPPDQAHVTESPQASGTMVSVPGE